MRVALLISTINEGIEKIPAMLLSEFDDITYVVSHQYTEEKFRKAPQELHSRKDVLISQMEGKGVARSRNNALWLCPDDVDIALFADDDGHYKREYIDNLKKLAEKYPQTDLFCLKIQTNDGEPRYNSRYYDIPVEITDTYQLSVATPELAIRPQRVKGKKVWFDSRFGAGAGFVQFADENVFIHDCIKAGLSVWFYPQYVVNIPYENTIKRMARYDARRVRALGAMDQRTRGTLVAYLKAFWFSISYMPSVINQKHSPFRYLADRLSGVRYMSKLKRPQNDIL